MLYFCCFPLHCNEIHVRFLFKRYISSVYNSLFLLRSLVFATVAGCRARESMLKRLFTVIRTTLGVDIYYVISALWALDYRNFYSIAMLHTNEQVYQIWGSFFLVFIAFSNTSNGLSEFADFSVLMTFVFVAPRTHSCMHAKRDMPDNFSNSHSKRQSFFFQIAFIKCVFYMFHKCVRLQLAGKWRGGERIRDY